MDKFNVGDDVRLTRNSTDCRNDLEKGDVGVIDKCDSGCYYVKSNKGTTYISGSGLELVKSNNKIEVGDTLQNKTNQEVKVKMKLKEMKKANLTEAKKQADVEKVNAEIQQAKQEYIKAIDALDSIDRAIAKQKELKKPYLEILESFKLKE